MFPVWVLFHGFGFALFAVVFVSANLPCSCRGGREFMPDLRSPSRAIFFWRKWLRSSFLSSRSEKFRIWFDIYKIYFIQSMFFSQENWVNQSLFSKKNKINLDPNKGGCRKPNCKVFLSWRGSAARFVQNRCVCWRACAFSTLLLEEPVAKNTLVFQISFGEALALGA